MKHTCPKCSGSGRLPPGPWRRPGPLFQCKVQGVWPTLGTSGVWSDAYWEMVVGNHLPIPIDLLPQIGIDVASKGFDYSSFFSRWGPCGMNHEEVNGWDQVRVAAHAIDLCRHWASAATKSRPPQAKPIDPKHIQIKVDDDGVGGGVVAILRSEGYSVVPVSAASRASRDLFYPNKRSELWFDMLDRARAGNLDLSRLSADSLRRLKSQCMVVEWSLQGGRRVVEDKEITKKKCGRSPDSADSMHLAFYGGGEYEAPPVLDEPDRPSLFQRVFGGKRP